MTPQQIATEMLRGWHAAEADALYDFRESPDWQKGWLLWLDAHVGQRMRAKLRLTQ